jgi:hypothetical protein
MDLYVENDKPKSNFYQNLRRNYQADEILASYHRTGQIESANSMSKASAHNDWLPTTLI